MDFLIRLAVVGLFAWMIWSVLRPRPVFVVRITGGVPRAARGKVMQSFLDEVRAVCGRGGIRRGTVRGVVRGGRIALAFSRGIPPAVQQQLRNVWAMSGWSVPPRRG
jgi:hypothetical protein